MIAVLFRNDLPVTTMPSSTPSDDRVRLGGDPGTQDGALESTPDVEQRATAAVDTDRNSSSSASGTPKVVVRSALLVALPWIEVRTAGTQAWKRVTASGPLMELERSPKDREVTAPGHRQTLLRSDAGFCVVDPANSLSLTCEEVQSAVEIAHEFMSGSRLSPSDQLLLSDCHVAGATPNGFAIAVDASAFQSLFGSQAEARLFLALPCGRRMDVRWTPTLDQRIAEPVESSLFAPAERRSLDVRTHVLAASAGSGAGELEFQLHAIDDFDVRSNSFRKPMPDIRERAWGRLVIQPMPQLEARRMLSREACQFAGVALGSTYSITVNGLDRKHFGRTAFRFEGNPIDVALQTAPRFRGRLVPLTTEGCPIGGTARVRVSYDDPGEAMGLAAWGVDEEVPIAADGQISVAAIGAVPANPLVPVPAPFPAALLVSVAGYEDWKQAYSWGAGSEIDAGTIDLTPIPADLSVRPLVEHRHSVWLAAFTSQREKEFLVTRTCQAGDSTQLFFEERFDPTKVEDVLLVRNWSGDASAFERTLGDPWTEVKDREYTIAVLLSESVSTQEVVTIGWSWHGIDFPFARLDAVQAQRQPLRYTIRAPESGLSLWSNRQHASGGHGTKRTVRVDSVDATVTL